MDKAVTIFGHGINHRKAQATSFTDPLGGEKRVKNTTANSGVNSRTAVGNLNANGLRLDGYRTREFAAGRDRSSQPEFTPVRHGVTSIDTDIEQRLADL